MRSIVYTMILTMLFPGMIYSAEWTQMTNEEFRTEYKKMFERFTKIGNYSVNVSMESYENTSDKTVHEVSKGYISKYGDKIHSFLVGIHTIQNHDTRLVIDTANKIIVVTNSQSTSPEEISPGITDEYLKKISSARKKYENGVTYYNVQLPSGLPFSSYTIGFNQKGLINDVNITMNKDIKNDRGEDIQPCVRIKYEEWNVTPSYKDSDYSFSKYVTKLDGKFILKDVYQDYEFHDQRPEFQQP